MKMGKYVKEIEKIIDSRPTKLYKYYSLDSSYTFEMLKTGEVYFASHLEFNDPFECNFCVKGPGDIRKAKKRMVDVLMESDGVDDAKALKMAEERLRNLRYSMKDGKNALLNLIQTKTSMFCLSEKKDNILMWPHYANKHTGICVEFNVNRINEPFWMLAFPVEYSDITPVIRYGDSMGPNEWIKRTILTKASLWSYEAEWRVIENRNGPCKKRLPSNAISSVILGCKINPDKEMRVRNIMTKHWPQAEIYRAKLPDKGDVYALEFVKE